MVRISRLVALSSTMSARTPRRSAGERLSANVRSACMPRRAVKENSDPVPASLMTPIPPPISSASCFEMARPRPVPPYCRVVEASTWLNLSKSRPILSSGIPVHVHAQHGGHGGEKGHEQRRREARTFPLGETSGVLFTHD